MFLVSLVLYGKFAINFNQFSTSQEADLVASECPSPLLPSNNLHPIAVKGHKDPVEVEVDMGVHGGNHREGPPVAPCLAAPADHVVGVGERPVQQPTDLVLSHHEGITLSGKL